MSTAGTERSSISLTWRRWVRTRSTRYSRDDLENGFPPDHSAETTLRERPSEEEEDGEARSSKTPSGEGLKSEEKGVKGADKWQQEEDGLKGKEA